MSVSAQTRGKALTVRCVREKVVNVCWPTSIFSVDRFFLVHSISHKPRPKLIIPLYRVKGRDVEEIIPSFVQPA